MAAFTDRRPSRLLAALFRAPAALYRHRLGWLFGKRLILVNHRGRRSGRPYATVLEVVATGSDPLRWYVAAAWGKQADWLRNLEVHPATSAMVGTRAYAVTASVVPTDEAATVFAEYVARHRLAARMIGRVIGVDMVDGDPVDIARRLPLVALTVDETDTEPEPVARVTTTRRETQATYDRIAPLFEVVEGFWERKARSAGLAALAPRPGERILEVGPGTGTSLVAIASGVAPSGMAIGVDLSARMCKESWRRLTRGGTWGIGRVVRGDATRLPLAKGVHDAVFISFTLELFDTPEIPVVLAECRRVMRPGGRIVVVALHKATPPPVMQRTYEWGHRRFPRLLDCRPIYVDRAIAEAGFTIEEVRRLSLWGLPAAVVRASVPLED